MIANPPNTFAMLISGIRFFSSYNHRVCEWRPSIYSVSSVLENWGSPVFCGQMVESQNAELLVWKSSRAASMIGEKDVLILAGCCNPSDEVQDFRTSVARRRPRYAATIAPPWVGGNTESQLWKSFAMLDTALTGDHWADLRAVYCSGAIESCQCDLTPSSAEVRVSNDAYRSGGVAREEDPIGMAQTRCPRIEGASISDCG